jgi:4-amino-4-deoxy-L-arabinose transferase-like glycosyltransferase
LVIGSLVSFVDYAMFSSSPSGATRWKHLLLVIGLAGVVRGGWLWWSFDDLRADPDSYRKLAVHVLETGTYGYRLPTSPASASLRPTAFRPPLYPWLLVGCGWTDHVGGLSVAVLHFVMGVSTVVLVWLLGRWWRLGDGALWASALAACDPILVRHSSLVMTETAATLLAVLGLLGLTRLTTRPTLWTGVWTGGILGLSILCRPTFLPWCGAVAAVILLTPALDVPRRWRASAALLVGAGLILAPWVARNLLVLGRPLATTTHGGYTVLLGNNESYYRFLADADWRAVWHSEELDARCSAVKAALGHDEIAFDRWAYREAWDCIRRQPGMFVRACLVRVAYLWGLVPHRIDSAETTAGQMVRYAVGLWYGLLFLLAATGSVSLGRRLWHPPWLWGLLLGLSFTAVHLLYWSNLRMRAPLMPVVCLAAVVGIRACFPSKSVLEELHGSRGNRVRFR